MPILGPPRFCKWLIVQVSPKRKGWNPPFHLAHDFVGQAFRKGLSGQFTSDPHDVGWSGGGSLPTVGASPRCLVPLCSGELVAVSSPSFFLAPCSLRVASHPHRLAPFFFSIAHRCQGRCTSYMGLAFKRQEVKAAKPVKADAQNSLGVS